MEEMTSLISNVGFPIFACVTMFNNNKELAKALNDVRVTLEGMNLRLNDIERSNKND